jgi:hypothetical protein
VKAIAGLKAEEVAHWRLKRLKDVRLARILAAGDETGIRKGAVAGLA